MKNLLFFFVVVVFSHACKTKNSMVKDELNQGTNGLYKVNKIDSINSFYIVYLEREGKKYKVVSKKTKDDIKCNKIILKEKYFFNLTSILDDKIKLGDVEFSSSNSLMVDCFYFDEHTKICKEESKGIYDLFKTENLLGLCYIKTQ